MVCSGLSYNVAFTCNILLFAMHAVVTSCIQNPVKHLKWSFFAEIVKGFQPQSIFAETFILDIYLGFEYAFGLFFPFAV